MHKLMISNVFATKKILVLFSIKTDVKVHTELSIEGEYKRNLCLHLFLQFQHQTSYSRQKISAQIPQEPVPLINAHLSTLLVVYLCQSRVSVSTGMEKTSFMTACTFWMVSALLNPLRTVSSGLLRSASTSSV